jgi:hypothetical protein
MKNVYIIFFVIGFSFSVTSCKSKIVYVSGGSVISDKVHMPCYWKDSTRHDLPVIDPSKGGRASSIFISGSDIYVSGDVANPKGIPESPARFRPPFF